MDSVKITNTAAKAMINGKKVILVNDSDIYAYTNATNYYSAGVYGWNYSIGYNDRHNCYVICGYRIPNSVLKSAGEVIEMTQNEARQ